MFSCIYLYYIYVWIHAHTCTGLRRRKAATSLLRASLATIFI